MNDKPVHTPSTQRQIVRALALIGALGFGQAALAADTAQDSAAQARPVTRAEVIADLALWRRAGVDQHEEVARYGIDLPAYQAALARYHALRRSAAYAEEVTRIATARGEAAPSHVQ